MINIIRIFASGIFLAGSMISAWFLVANMRRLQPALIAFVLIVGAFSVLAFQIYGAETAHRIIKRLTKLKKTKYFVPLSLVLITTIGVVARLFFKYRFSYSPVSDPVTFFDAAKSIANGLGQQGNSYVAFQPYLSAYNNLLSVSMKFVSDPWLATILLNTVIDILSSLLAFRLLKKLMKPGSAVPLLAYGVWLLNPLNIVFSVISLPVIVVNFFIVAGLLVAQYLIQSTKELSLYKSALYATIFGLTVGLGNTFRPIFIVMIIALILILVFVYLNNQLSSKYLKISLIFLAIISVIFVAIQTLNIGFVSRQTGLSAAKNPSGWSMYVGSNWESRGEWRPYNNYEMQEICKSSLEEKNFDECHNNLRREALKRYTANGVFGLAGLIIQKLYHQATDQNYFYNAEHSIVGYAESKTYILIDAYMTTFMTLLFLLSSLSLFNLAKKSYQNSVDTFLLYAALLFIGWFISFALVESAPRYSTILYPLFIIFALNWRSNTVVADTSKSIKRVKKS